MFNCFQSHLYVVKECDELVRIHSHEEMSIMPESAILEEMKAHNLSPPQENAQKEPWQVLKHHYMSKHRHEYTQFVHDEASCSI